MTWKAVCLSATVGMFLLAFLNGTVAHPAQAQEPTEVSDARLSFEEPVVTGDGVSVSVLMETNGGEPISRQPVDFFVVPDFFGERALPLGTVLTNTKGRATVSYTPSWPGTHKITVLFLGDAAYTAAETSAVFTISGLAGVAADEPVPLEPIRRWAGPVAVAVTLTVWLILGGILARVTLGIRREAQPEEPLKSLPTSVVAKGRRSTVNS